MDTSETYIRMCDCLEIQEQWTIPPYPNDYCHCREDGRISWGSHISPDIVDGWVFLPRQDQIQEMFKGYDAFILAGKFNGEMENLITGNPSKWTMEQLWLAFYMHEKHKKTWDGKKWVA